MYGSWFNGFKHLSSLAVSFVELFGKWGHFLPILSDPKNLYSLPAASEIIFHYRTVKLFYFYFLLVEVIYEPKLGKEVTASLSVLSTVQIDATGITLRLSI